MWTPPLRESFAMPFLQLQSLVLSYTIRCVPPYPAAIITWLHGRGLSLQTVDLLMGLVDYSGSIYTGFLVAMAILTICFADSGTTHSHVNHPCPPHLLLSNLGSFSVTCAQSTSHSLSHFPPHTVCHSCECPVLSGMVYGPPSPPPSFSSSLFLPWIRWHLG